MEHLMDDGGIRAMFREGQIIDIGKPDTTMAEASPIEADTRAFEHFPVRVDSNRPPRAIGGKL
jgi:hypothetical protein